jgi:hypothetical protein
MAILAFRFVLAAFLAYFLRKEDKRALLSLLLEVLGSGSREADSEEVDGKVVYGKDVGNGKAGSEKVRGFLADFALSIFLLSIKFYKERFSIYFL